MASSTAGAVCSDRVVCRCLQVTEMELVEAMTTHGVQDLREVRRHTGAGGGCMACHRLIRTYLARHPYASSSSSLPSCSER
jgi:NAD(P)H-nitrite reductase large subunit